MRPVPIPPERIWDGAERIVVGPPSGDPTDDTIRSVEVLSETVDLGGQPFNVFRVLIQLDPGDLEALQRDPHFWVSIYGAQLQPFDVDIEHT